MADTCTVTCSGGNKNIIDLKPASRIPLAACVFSPSAVSPHRPSAF